MYFLTMMIHLSLKARWSWMTYPTQSSCGSMIRSWIACQWSHRYEPSRRNHEK